MIITELPVAGAFKLAVFPLVPISRLKALDVPFDIVNVELKVLNPPIVCVPVVTTPPKLAEAGSRFKTVPVNVAPFAFGVLPIAASVIVPPEYCGMFNVFPINVAAPDVPVVVKVIAPCLELNVLQSVELNAPLLVALAVGTLSVITGVVVPFATVDDKSVPLVPKVSAATLVTVPTPAPPTKAIVPVAPGRV